ncbi:hypothetical protein [Jannaschia sp. R86511]|uniref:hypothetical protein n=1 Tax=Jannaschia sp. R86511 TaxID=3093853 RepID=UPI0036D3EBD3
MTSTTPTAPRGSSSVRPYLWVTGVLWLLPLVTVLVLYLVLPHHVPPDECQPTVFGCMSQADIVLLLAFFASPYLGLAGLVGCVVVAGVQAWRAR